MYTYNKKLTAFLVITICTIFFNISYSYSQTLLCPIDSISGCPEFKEGSETIVTSAPDCIIEVKYLSRVCNGAFEFYIQDIIRTGNCESMNELEYNEKYMSSFREWVDIILIEKLLIKHASEFPVPPCNIAAPGITFNTYSASCGVWVKCTFDVDSASKVCERGWLGTGPEWKENGKFKVAVSKYQSCGKTCCQKKYEVCKDPEGKILIRQIEKKAIGNCTDQGNYDKPCQNGC